MLRRILPLTAFLAALAIPALAQTKSPLPIEGKTSLFQRVLIRERIEARIEPNSEATAVALSPLQVFFVYERDGDWMQIGAGDQGEGLMWIPEGAAIPWNQNIVATLEGSDNVGRVLFFNDIDPIYDILESENPGGAAEDARDEALAAEQEGEPSETVIALGPRETIDQRQNLYVMPILSMEESVFDIGPFVNLLQVAVASANAPNISKQPSDDKARGDLKTAVVFVVDTTISMGPYISATRDALQEVYREAAGSAAAGAISFGLVGYRDSLEAAPDLGYDVRTFVDLQQGLNVDNFLTGIAQMQEADSSSKNFREDSYRGVEYALEDMDWSEFGGRYIVLVTDAGPRAFGDPYSATGLSAESLNRIIRERIGGAMAVMHLRTERGAGDHPSAEAAYKQLTAFPNSTPLYYPIENGDPAIYKESARSLGGIVAQHTSSYRRSGGDEILDEDAITDEGDSRFSGLSTASRTMQLAYLGKTEGARAPDLFEAYVADRDYDRTGLKPLSIRLLISKADLSNLEQAMRIIVDQAERNVVNPDQFFAQVLGVAADMSRRPDQVSRQSDPNLAETVGLEEYLSDLPYKSQIMAITEDDWVRLSISEQQTIVNGLYDKIERYRRYNESTDQWVDYLGAGPQAGNLLYPMLLDDLP